MVFFTCDQCGDSLKKRQVDQHLRGCRSASFSCMDCLQTFDRQSYVGHIKCITENEKYGGSGYVDKPNKGELKQDAWVQNVRAAIDRLRAQFPAQQQNSKRLTRLLESVQAHQNTPRKEPKFVKFLQNSLRVRDLALCRAAWTAIKAEADRRQDGQAIPAAGPNNGDPGSADADTNKKMDNNSGVGGGAVAEDDHRRVDEFAAATDTCLADGAENAAPANNNEDEAELLRRERKRGRKAEKRRLRQEAAVEQKQQDGKAEEQLPLLHQLEASPLAALVAVDADGDIVHQMDCQQQCPDFHFADNNNEDAAATQPVKKKKRKKSKKWADDAQEFRADA